MSTLQTVVLIVHTVIALLIVVLVLLQRGKGAEAGAAFGAGASGTVFGARGSSSFFSRATAIMATAFFASSLALAYMSSQRSDAPESLLETAPEVQEPVEEEVAVPVPDLPALEEGGNEGGAAPAEAETMPELEAPADESPETAGEEPQPQ